MASSKSIHPFPARMAPDLAIQSLNGLQGPSVVLDPMTGSGTVAKHAASMGHQVFAFDLDPLAVLMTQVGTTQVNFDLVERMLSDVMQLAISFNDTIAVDWIDSDRETLEFTEFWFGDRQRKDLRKIAVAIKQLHNITSFSNQKELNVLRLGLSRIIITKKRGASLAWDVSHSRPHKKMETSDYDVLVEFEKSTNYIIRGLKSHPSFGSVVTQRGDARTLDAIQDCSVDLVLTSPPYLNAIDYMRGHRMSLVWLGHQISSLRYIRSTSIGAERGPDDDRIAYNYQLIVSNMGDIENLPRRHKNMALRYAVDVYRMMAEVRRVLKIGGKATLVVGNSCLNGIFIRNSEAVNVAAQQVGLELSQVFERDLPTKNRYLPINTKEKSSITKRMRTETILEFTRGN